VCNAGTSKWGSVPLRSDIKGTELPPTNILIPLERQASTTELGKLFQIFTMRADKNALVNHNRKNGYRVYSYCHWCELFR